MLLLVSPYTERLFREAGIGPGQRALDLGSGVGDVSMLLGRIVGPSGEVVGIERDARSNAWANARVAEAGLRNISFTEADVNQIVNDQPFDAAVGRFILMFLPDPASVLRSLTQSVRPGGILAFQECSWVPFLASAARFPLLSKLLSTIHETFLRAGVNPEMGIALYQIFQQVGLPAPAMHMETLSSVLNSAMVQSTNPKEFNLPIVAATQVVRRKAAGRCSRSHLMPTANSEETDAQPRQTQYRPLMDAGDYKHTFG